jgi:hypothetical protein
MLSTLVGPCKSLFSNLKGRSTTKGDVYRKSSRRLVTGVPIKHRLLKNGYRDIEVYRVPRQLNKPLAHLSPFVRLLLSTKTSALCPCNIRQGAYKAFSKEHRHGDRLQHQLAEVNELPLPGNVKKASDLCALLTLSSGERARPS